MGKEDIKEITESTALRVINFLHEDINENLYKKRKYYFGNTYKDNFIVNKFFLFIKYLNIHYITKWPLYKIGKEISDIIIVDCNEN